MYPISLDPFRFPYLPYKVNKALSILPNSKKHAEPEHSAVRLIKLILLKKTGLNCEGQFFKGNRIVILP